jgi:hypothetical protein
MLTPTFRFFEAICGELADDGSRVVTREDFEARQADAPLLNELKEEHGKANSFDAMLSAVDVLSAHFATKQSALPFSLDTISGRFSALDNAYIDFIEEMYNIRSNGKKARDFEIKISARINGRTTGAIHRVGHPRTASRSRSEFNAHLALLGFNGKVLIDPKEKDGGLDILWFLPLGSHHHRPVVSIQCKNSPLKKSDIERPPTGTTSASLSCHKGLQSKVHMYCVMFNDYIDSKFLPPKPLDFVPLG